MQWEKTISIRVTIRRLVVAVVATSMVVNLIIVGAVVRAESPPITPTATSTWTSDSRTTTFSVITSTAGENQTATQTREPTQTNMPTDTQTQINTNQPTATLCVVRFDWPVYRVRRGDTLFSLAVATGPTTQELMLANCLTSDLIFQGQLLHVPRLPINTFTPTPTATQTNTPPTPGYVCDRAEWIADVTVPLETVMLPDTRFIKTWRLKNIGSCTWTTAYSVVYMDGEPFRAPLSTMLPVNVPPGGTIDISLDMIAPSVPGSYGSSWMFRNASGMLFGIGEQANLPWSVTIRVQDPTPTPGTPIGFQNPSVCLGSSNNTNLYLAFAVSLSNAQDVSSVTAISGQSIVVPLQDTGGSVYSGAMIGSGGYAPGMVVPYYFVAQRRSGQSIRSDDLISNLLPCGPL